MRRDRTTHFAHPKAGRDAWIGVVLAGGGSRRMGRDKALIEVDGRSLLDHALARLDAVCGEVVIADAQRRYVPTRTSVADGPGAGPAAAILGAAARFPGQTLLVLACDLPNVPAALLANLTTHGEDWVLPGFGNHLEPLVALYRPAALAALHRRVATGQLALHRLVEEDGFTIHKLGHEEISPFGDPRQIFHNVNRPRDLDTL